MAGNSEKQGKDLLLTILNDLKNIDPRIIPFDNDEIQAYEYGVLQGVRDVFGSGSPEYGEFEGFRITAGNISRGDSRAEKQSKYELGLPKAVERLEELIILINRPGEHIQDLSVADLVEIEPATKAPPAKPSPPKAAPRTKAKTPDARSATKTPAQPASKAAAKTTEPRKGPSPAPSGQPGRILLLEEGGDSISTAVTTLLKKIGIDLVLLEEGTSSGMENILALKDIAFTIMSVSSGSKGGFSGLTSVIGKPHPRHESVFKLGLLVGSLGPGKVVILHSSERLQDIPEDLFGIRYIPFKEEGGWQIYLLKYLKANGFFIDANLLFD